MDSALLNRLRERSNILPTCKDYAELLDYARIMTGRSLDDLRDALGLATYEGWADFLGVKGKKRLTKNYIREWILTAPGKSGFSFKQNKRKRMPARTVEVSPSPWDKPECRNFTVCGFINGKLMFCENGLSIEGAVNTVWAAKQGN